MSEDVCNFIWLNQTAKRNFAISYEAKKKEKA